MLTNEEIEWLNNYHQTVYEKLSPDLNEEEKSLVTRGNCFPLKRTCLTLRGVVQHRTALNKKTLLETNIIWL